MSTPVALFITFSVIIIGLVLLKSAILLTELITHKRVSFSSLFFNFKQKMWMTIGLGILFFNLYLFLLYMGAFSLTAQDKLSFFFDAYQNPATYAYRGLFFFVVVSVSIYLARMVIISLYNSRN
ncbi:MAG TPA: hypothetical protein PLC42_06445 [Parachlamydiaceae bacterium]|nr:hypothetical protein [Parachlamydiaceae bacterium]